MELHTVCIIHCTDAEQAAATRLLSPAPVPPPPATAA